MMLLALLLAVVDPCAPPEPASRPDPAAAQAYLEVGESEAGHPDALEAFREALRLDPANARALAGFQAACRAQDDQFRRARTLMEAGDRAAAIRLFEEILSEGPSPPAALLEGICLYELEQDRPAERLLLEAVADESVADSARFFLGLIARRRGDQAQAERLFAGVAQGTSPMREQADRLLRESPAARSLSISLLAEAGYDSNVTLSPSGAPAGADGLGSLGAALVWKPIGGLFARATGFYRAQTQLNDYNLGAVGLRLRRAGERAVPFRASPRRVGPRRIRAGLARRRVRRAIRKLPYRDHLSLFRHAPRRAALGRTASRGVGVGRSVVPRRA